MALYIFKFHQKGMGKRYELQRFYTEEAAAGHAATIDKRKGCEMFSFYAPNDNQMRFEMLEAVRRIKARNESYFNRNIKRRKNG
jgi:hypothetical protein